VPEHGAADEADARQDDEGGEGGEGTAHPSIVPRRADRGFVCWPSGLKYYWGLRLQSSEKTALRMMLNTC
jgi:hypothetical protein